ncbi:hypothetical protein WJX73_003952 [Symbiochloris irregularis]|uniref:Glycosyltransferase 2-like domain-containing protein n=1 Tax=Symbiochloris irregularis TaxID=706552 RepID=A0AAW1NQ52_9CHLO
MVDSGSNHYLYGYSTVNGAPEVNVYGAILIGASVFCLLFYLIQNRLRKSCKSRKIMHPAAAGAFRLAAARNEIAQMELISRCQNFNVDEGVLGFTALHAAAAQGQADAICWLVQHGADVKRVKEDDWADTALHYASASGRLPAVQALLAAGCDPSATNFAGSTPADVAARKGKNAVAVYLTNVVSGNQPVPSRSELIDNRKFEWSYKGLHSDPELTARGHYGIGTAGTVPKFTVPVFRFLAAIQQVAAYLYLTWRALRSLTPGIGYIYSMTVWVCEFVGITSTLMFLTGLWSQIERPTRFLDDMLDEATFPHVDVFICVYSEPVEIIEPTVIAAVNMNYPGAKLHVHVLDDNKSPPMAAMVSKLQCQMRYMGRQASLHYIARDKTPQDFWNVARGDPLSNFGRFFYGPVLQGRDGAGAGPCCGTGVVFQRDILVSMGGQSYGSITEDFNTAMNLLGCGFATMYLNERLSFGMAPEEISSLFSQRLRWTMGSIQILLRGNPQRIPGLTTAQAFMFFDSTIYPFMAFLTCALAFIPIIYVFAEYSPCVAPRMYEFVAAFTGYYALNRIMMWWLYRGAEGGDNELWRGIQMVVWLTPNCMLAVYNVLKAELPLTKWLSKREIGFAVTKKDKAKTLSRWQELKKALWIVWPHIFYYVLFITAAIFFIVRAATGYYTLWRAMLVLVALGWGLLLLLCLWPPLTMLLPRVETAKGWRVMWTPFIGRPEEVMAPDASTHAAGARGRMTGSPASRSVTTPRRISFYGRRSTASPQTKTDTPGSARVSIFTGLPEVDAAAEQIVTHLAQQPFQWQKTEASLNAMRSGSLDLSAGSANLGNDKRSLSAHRRLPSLSEVPEKMNGVHDNQHSELAAVQVDPYNTGRIGLPVHTENVFRNSALLTSIVLPERADSTTQPVVLLEPDGSFAPAPLSLGLQRRSMRTRSGSVGGAFAGSQGSDASADARRRSIGSRFSGMMRFSSSPRHPAAKARSPPAQTPVAPLEKLGEAVVIPTEPASIYEHTIMAQPNFENREPPASNYWFLAVHLLMLAAAIVGSVIDALYHPRLPVSGSRN